MVAEAPAGGALRGMLLAILLLGMAGTLVELWFLDHTEDWWQLVPLYLLGLGLVAALAYLVAPGTTTRQPFRGVMLLFVASGIIGVWLHYQGNTEFELEMYPSRAGWELFWESLRGATPVLAPGTMTVLGLVGLASTYRDSSRCGSG